MGKATEDLVAERARACAATNAAFALEGIYQDDATLELQRRWILGEITTDQRIALILQQDDEQEDQDQASETNMFSVDYEVLCDCVGNLTAHQSALLYQVKNSANPDPERIAQINAELTRLRTLRRHLPTDPPGIRVMLDELSAQVRALPDI